MATGTIDVVRADRATGPEFYDRVYRDVREAGGDAAALPWSRGGAHPALVRWLDVVAPQLVRCGGRVVVPACGVGEEVREVDRRGYEVIGFDASAEAIAWAHRIDPDRPAMYVEADLFELPARWRHRFDLVVEVNTLQALVPKERGDMLRAMGDLLAPHGHLLAVGRAAPPPDATDVVPDESADLPPWPIDPAKLVALAAEAGLEPDGDIHRFEDDARPGRWVFRGMFRRSS